jgi:hypothetical protein
MNAPGVKEEKEVIKKRLLSWFNEPNKKVSQLTQRSHQHMRHPRVYEAGAYVFLIGISSIRYRGR